MTVLIILLIVCLNDAVSSYICECHGNSVCVYVTVLTTSLATVLVAIVSTVFVTVLSSVLIKPGLGDKVHT